jgi:cyanophycinase
VEGNLFGLPEGTVQNSGALLIAGGGRLPGAVYEEFIRLAGGSSARIVLVPSAYPYRGMPHIRRAFNGWTEYHVKSFDFLHTDDPEQANTAEFLKPLEEATGIWFAGGGQERLTYRYGGSLAAEAIRRVMMRGGVVGGTSAGASVLSERMIRHGSRTEAEMAPGLGLTTRLVIDQHFSERGRFPRLLGVLEEQTGCVGLGVDEETAVILQGNGLRVLGKGRAALFLPPTQPNGATAVYRLRAEESAEAVMRDPMGRVIGFEIHKN